MKRIGRVTLFCTKRDRFGELETLRVVVNEKDEFAAKAKYEAMGYTVRTT